MKNSVFFLLAVVIALSGCARRVIETKPVRRATVAQSGSGVTVKKASDWAVQYPDIYASYLRNGDNDESHSYTERYPAIVTLYEGMAFSKFYNSARGHVYSLDDIYATGRPHPLANCFACKTPDLHALILEKGIDVYKVPFEEMRANISEPISCFNCHANEPGSITISHLYLSNALGQDIESFKPVATLSCAQCHVEYYFDPTTKAVTLPYNGLSAKNPDDILAYYNNLMVDGLPFADYVNPRSGVRQIKVQHPEFETYTGKGSVHANTFSCADCHMGTAVNAKGKEYINHEWTSPLNNERLLKNTCAQCHTDLKSQVKSLQAAGKDRCVELGNSLAAVMEDFVIAVTSKKYSEEQLNAIRSVFRDSQFYWDFVFVENSKGAHNSRLTKYCLDKSEAIMKQAKDMIARL